MLDVKVLGFEIESITVGGVPSELAIESTGGVVYAKVTLRKERTVKAIVTR